MFIRIDLSVPTYFQAQYEHALCYLEVIREADALYGDGGQSQLLGIRLFEAEKAHIESAASVLFSDQPVAANFQALALSYATSGKQILRFGLRPAEYLTWLERALTIAQPLGDLATEAYLIGEMGVALLNSAPSRAVKLFEQELEAWQTLNNPEREQAAVFNLGLARFRSGDKPSGLSLVTRYLEKARQEGDSRAEAIALTFLAEAHVSMHQVQQAILAAETSLELFRGLGDQIRTATALAILTGAYMQAGYYSKAMESAKSGLDSAQQLGLHSAEVVHCLQISSILRETGDARKAISYATEALLLIRQLEAGYSLSTHNECAALGSIGNAYAHLGDGSTALKYHQQRLAVSRRIADPTYESNALGDIGRAMAELGDRDGAHEFYEKQLAITSEIDFKIGTATCLWSMALNFSAAGRLAEALTKGRAALAIYEKIGSHRAGALRPLLRDWENAFGSYGLTANSFTLSVLNTILHLWQELRRLFPWSPSRPENSTVRSGRAPHRLRR